MRAIALIMTGTFAILAALAWAFQDDVGLWLINPSRSYEAYTPPPAPGYASDESWLARGDGDGPVDIFFIHNNIYRGDGRWNAPHDRDDQLPFLRDVLLPLEAGPFQALGPLWAPRYRQPTFYARFTQKQPGRASRDTAYRDVSAAFSLFLAERAPHRPYIVVGYGDGALLAARLLEQRIEPNVELKRRMAAAYAIEMPLSLGAFGDMACSRPGQPRCLVAFAPVDRRFTRYQERLRSRTLTLRADAGYVSTSDGPLLCAPPSIPAETEALTASSAAPIRTELWAKCEGGLLLFGPPEEGALRQARFFGRQWLPDRINHFYGALKLDAFDRSAAVLALLKDEQRQEEIDAATPPPFGPVEEIEAAPINTVPTDRQ